MSYASTSTNLPWTVELSNRGGESGDKTPSFSIKSEDFLAVFSSLKAKKLSVGDEITLTLKAGRSKTVEVIFYVNRKSLTTAKARLWPTTLPMPQNGQKLPFEVLGTQIKHAGTKVVTKRQKSTLTMDDVVNQTLEEFKIVLSDRLKKLKA